MSTSVGFIGSRGMKHASSRWYRTNNVFTRAPIPSFELLDDIHGGESSAQDLIYSLLDELVTDPPRAALSMCSVVDFVTEEDLACGVTHESRIQSSKELGMHNI